MLSMTDPTVNRGTGWEWGQTLLALACLTSAILAMALSAKGWLAALGEESSYKEVVELREDASFGVARQLAFRLLCLSLALFAAVVTITAWRRRRFHYAACLICGLAVIAAGVAWLAGRG